MKIIFKRNWKFILSFVAVVIIWILIRENIPNWGYILFGIIDFDGDDKVDLSSIPITGSQNRTVSARWRTSSVAVQIIINWNGDNTVPHDAFYFAVENSQLTLRTTDSNRIWAFADANDGKWHQGVLILDGTNTSDLSLVVDGNLLTPTSTADGTLNTKNDVENNIGVRWDVTLSSFMNYFIGELDEIAVWDTNLSVDQREQLYNSRMRYTALQIQTLNLVGFWPLDDGPDGSSADGDLIRDRSGNNLNGIGDDGANNTGLIWKAGILPYPSSAILVRSTIITPLLNEFYLHKLRLGAQENLRLGLR